MVQYTEPKLSSRRSSSISRGPGGLGIALVLLALAISCGRRDEKRRTPKSKTTVDSLRNDRLLADRTGAVGPSGLRLSPGKTPPLRVLSAALTTIDEKYVAPNLIKTAKMFDKALEFIEAERAELRITGSAKERSVLVRVGARSRRFAVGSLSGVAMVYVQLKTILGYIQKTMKAHSKPTAKELAELEYAAVNGIVSTLDPHSVLMPPKVYGEMQIRTRGAFGGIGIVISIRDGKLTVISPIDETPAARAGIRAGDRIVKIGDESTVNMRLSEAVSLLRGKPGSPVIFWVGREGWPEPRRFDIVRSRIEIKSVTSKLLPGRVGYVRVNRFSHNTTDELKDHLRKLKRARVKGVILDMWNNPGGLLQQAEMVADTFLSTGDIVITEAARKVVLRVRKASAETTVFTKPVVVLVNRGSASAAEIVAGALKNQGRALVIGETTFGKGTVQMLFDNPDGSALKMTVAQYLTPGGLSIQTVGVQPDVHTNAVHLRKTWTRMFSYEVDARRRAKRHDLLPARSQKNRHPTLRLDYLSPFSDTKARIRHQANVSANAAEAPVVELARLLLVRYAGTRSEMLRAGKDYLAEWGRAQEHKIIASLRSRKVDWKAPPPLTTPFDPTALEAKISVHPAGPAKAGSTVTLKLTVSNRGSQPLHRLHGRTDAPSYVFHERELIVGLVKPGETRSVSVQVKLPSHLRSSIQPVKVVLISPDFSKPKRLRAQVTIAGLPRPSFSLSYRLHDDVKGNGDGRPEPGETIRLRIRIQNSGPGVLDDGVVALRNLAGRGINIVKGRSTVKNLSAGGTRDVDLTFRVEPGFRKPVIKLELSVYGSKLRASLQGHIKLPLNPKTASVPGLVGEISPPSIQITKTPLAVDATRSYIDINGLATDNTRVQDLFVEVTNFDAKQVRHKAYYTAAARGTRIRKLPFKVRVPLWSGVNRILVVARENGEVMGFRRILVTKP
jgi:carboxyl-terminal processing protease